MKFLVIWHIDIALLSKEVMQTVLRMPAYAEPLEKSGKVIARYHVPGRHGGVWIYDVASNEELDLLLARSPVFNYSRYEVLPLAEMTPPAAKPVATKA
jgi:muconolactone delta-isomerase